MTLETDEVQALVGDLAYADEGGPTHRRILAQIMQKKETIATNRRMLAAHTAVCEKCRNPERAVGGWMTKSWSRFQPKEMCALGLHEMAKHGRTYMTKNGRTVRYCAPCKAEKQRVENGKKFTTNPYGLRRSSKADPPLTIAQIESALSAIPCAGCGARPTRRGVGGLILSHPTTDHAEGCPVPANRELETAS